MAGREKVTVVYEGDRKVVGLIGSKLHVGTVANAFNLEPNTIEIDGVVEPVDASGLTLITFQSGTSVVVTGSPRPAAAAAALTAAVAPTAAVVTPPAGTSADAMLHEISTGMAELRQAFAERMSATVAASQITEEKLRELRKVMNCCLLPLLPDEPSVEDLLAKQPDQGAFIWLTGPDSLSEPQQADRYEPHIKNNVSAAYQRLFHGSSPPRRLLWKDFANAGAHTYKPPGSRFPLSSKNDEVMGLSPTGPIVSLLGVELKKRLDMQAVHQAEAEFYVWDYVSQYPFCQLVTDLGRGGVAFYYQGHDAGGVHIIRRQVLGSMPAVYDFIARLEHNIPEHVMMYEADAQGFIFPKELQVPKRMKLHHELDKPPAGTAGAAIGGGGGGGVHGNGPGGSADAAAGSGGPPTGRSGGAAAGGDDMAGDGGVTSGATGGGGVREKVLQLLYELQADRDDVACMQDVEDDQAYIDGAEAMQLEVPVPPWIN